MKIKNLAFCGIMASILGVGAAYADNDATIIASKAYVDANDNLKQNEDMRYKNTLETYSGLNKTEAQQKADYPSMYTLKEAIDGIDLSGTLANLDYTDSGTGVVKAVSQDNGQIAVTKGTVGASEIAANAVTEEKINTGAVTINKVNDTAKEKDNVITSTNTTLLPTVAGVQKGVAYLKSKNGTAADGFKHSAGITYGDVKPELSWSLADTTDDAVNTIIKTNMDDYVPTVAAVEARVQQAEANASSNLTNVADTAASATWNPTAKTINVVTTSNAAGNKTDKLATSNHVQTSVSALKSYTDNIIGDTDMGTEAETLTGAIAELGTEKLDKNSAITPSTGAMNIVTYDANGLVTGGKILNTTGLNDINKSSNSGTTCTAANPCVLTYTGTNYKWTNMDTDGLNAVSDS